MEISINTRRKLTRFITLALLWIGLAEASSSKKSLKDFKGSDLYEEFGIFTKGKGDNLSGNENPRLGSINGSYNIFKERLFAEGEELFG